MWQHFKPCNEFDRPIHLKFGTMKEKTYLVIDFYSIWWLLKEPLVLAVNSVSLLAAGVLGHSLRSFTDGVFGQFTGQKQPDGGLDLAGADG